MIDSMIEKFSLFVIIFGGLYLLAQIIRAIIN